MKFKYTEVIGTGGGIDGRHFSSSMTFVLRTSTGRPLS